MRKIITIITYNIKIIKLFYYQTGHRSSEATRVLVGQGFIGTIYSMVGSITEWKAAGLPTVKGHHHLYKHSYQFDGFCAL